MVLLNIYCIFTNKKDSVVAPCASSHQPSTSHASAERDFPNIRAASKLQTEQGIRVQDYLLHKKNVKGNVVLLQKL